MGTVPFFILGKKFLFIQLLIVNADYALAYHFFHGPESRRELYEKLG